MDGFDQLSKTPQWEALKRAQAAAYELQIALESNPALPGNHEAYSARVELTRVENQLREHYKRREI